MIKSHIHRTKILDNLMTLGRDRIDASTLSMDGGPIQPGFTLDAENGNVIRDIPVTTDKTLFDFVFDYFAPAEVSIETDKSSIAADGVEVATLTITCEDTTETVVGLAAYSDGNKLGTFNVTVTAGVGTKAITIAEPGVYEYKTDPSTVDGVWGLPKFRDIQVAIIEGV